MQFHENLKRICDERGTSPTRVCIDLGLSTSKVSLWKAGGIPKPEILDRLAKHLGCTVMDFFWSYEDEQTIIERNKELEAREHPVIVDPYEEDILALYRSLGRK